MHEKVQQRNNNQSRSAKILPAKEERTVSRRSSRLCGSKRIGKSKSNESAGDFNVYLLLELIKGYMVKDKQREEPKPSSVLADIVETNQKEEVKNRSTSNVFSNTSFGKVRQTSSKLQNKRLDKILNSLDSACEDDGDDSDKSSLCLNLGKKIKQSLKDLKQETNKEKRQISNISGLQEARNLSKTTTNNRPQRMVSKLRFGDEIPNQYNEFNFMSNNDRNTSEVSIKVMTPWTRSKTKVFNLDAPKLTKEESYFGLRPVEYNLQNHFIN